MPVISVRLRDAAKEKAEKLKVVLRYKSKKITTRLPVVDIAIPEENVLLEFMQAEAEVLVEAHDKNGKVVGQAKPGGEVDPATGTIRLQIGKTLRIAIKMDDDFEGKFTLKALDPVTLNTYAKLTLETDYV